MYRTREMAARALVPFVLVTQIPSTVQTLLQELPLEPGPKLQQNRIHGTLLQVCSRAHASINQDTHTLCKDDTELGRGCCFNDRKDSCRVGFKTLVTSVCSYVVVLCTNQQRSTQFTVLCPCEKRVHNKVLYCKYE